MENRHPQGLVTGSAQHKQGEVYWIWLNHPPREHYPSNGDTYTRPASAPSVITEPRRTA